MTAGFIVSVWTVLLLTGCSAIGGGEIHKAETARDAEVTVDGLHRFQGSGFSEAWVRPGAEFALYSKVMLGPVFVSYKRSPTARRGTLARGNFALSDRQMKTFKRYLTEIFSAELEKSQKHRVVKEPGPNVLEVEPSIIDLVVNAPTDTLGRDRSYSMSTADMTLLLELRDSETGELLARIADRRTARSPNAVGLTQVYYTNPVSNSQAVRSTFRRWAQILVSQLDRLDSLDDDAS